MNIRDWLGILTTIMSIQMHDPVDESKSTGRVRLAIKGIAAEQISKLNCFAALIYKTFAFF